MSVVVFDLLLWSVVIVCSVRSCLCEVVGCDEGGSAEFVVVEIMDGNGCR